LKINEKTTRRKEKMEALNKVTAANASHTGKQVMLPEMIKRLQKVMQIKHLLECFMLMDYHSIWQIVSTIKKL